MSELTDEQIAAEERFLEGIPRWSIGALFLPPIWGPAHGLWIAILFYPLWLFADNMFYAAFSERTPLAIALAVIVGVALLGVTLLFSRLSQPYAAHRAHARGARKHIDVELDRLLRRLGRLGFRTRSVLFVLCGRDVGRRIFRTACAERKNKRQRQKHCQPFFHIRFSLR